MEVDCGGGVYIRSLVRDLCRSFNTRGTMVELVRTKQGNFGIDGCLEKEDWTVETLYGSMVKIEV